MTKYFYRVTFTLDDKENPVSLAFDFDNIHMAANFAELGYMGCDIIKSRIDCIENEIDTTNSPMWRIDED